MGKDRKPLGTLALVALAAILLSAVALAVDVDAARGGKGGPGNGGGTSATLTVSPDPAPAWDWFHAEGCGYAVGESVNVMVRFPTADYFFAVGVYDSGCVAFDFRTGEAGSYRVDAYQNLSGRKQTLVASDTFTVQ